MLFGSAQVKLSACWMQKMPQNRINCTRWWPSFHRSAQKRSVFKGNWITTIPKAIGWRAVLPWNMQAGFASCCQHWRRSALPSRLEAQLYTSAVRLWLNLAAGTPITSPRTPIWGSVWRARAIAAQCWTPPPVKRRPMRHFRGCSNDRDGSKAIS